MCSSPPSEITGQQGKILIVLDRANAASLCATIDADPWMLETPGALRELPGDGGPCDAAGPEVSFPAGDTVLTAAVVVPGSQQADASTPVLVAVDGDVTATIDGALLSD